MADLKKKAFYIIGIMMQQNKNQKGVKTKNKTSRIKMTKNRFSIYILITNIK